jgi:hypothetical protein
MHHLHNDDNVVAVTLQLTDDPVVADAKFPKSR